METRANYAIIGLFTLAVVAAGFLFVYWFSGSDTGQRREALRIVFSGSVAGLSTGSTVQFNGLRVGEVKTLELLPEDPRRVVALTEIDRSTPLRSDTRARLEFQGLTGVAQIALVGGEPSSPPLQPAPGQPVPTIFADPSGFQDLIESARNVARRADEVLSSVGQLVADNQGGINRTIQNVERFSQALSENAPNVDRFLAQVGAAAERIGPLAERLETLTTDVNALVRAVDPAKVTSTVDNIEGFTATLSQNRDNINNTLRDAAALTARLNESANKLDQTLTDVSAVAKAVDPARVGRTVENVERFATNLNNSAIVQNVDSFSKTLADNRENVATILRDGASLATRLNDSSLKLDQTLTDIGALAKAIDAGRINRTIENVEKFTAALDAQALNRTVANAEKFSASLAARSNDVEVTIREARSLTEKLNKSADRVDDVLKAAQGFLGGEGAGSGAGSAFGEVREAARAIRVLAENLDKRTADISSGLTRFTGSGLREIEAFASEGRRTLNDVSRTVRSIERNPSQVIFGGESRIPQYNQRR